MAYRLHPDRSMGADLSRVVREQLTRAARAALDRRCAATERVHAARKACKRIRAALVLARSRQPRLYARENAWCRDASQELGLFRDAIIQVAVWDALPDEALAKLDPGTRQQLRRKLAAHRRQIFSNTAAVEQVLRRFAQRMREAGKRLADWKFDGADFDAIADDLQRTYRAARQRFRKAYRGGRARDFHAWRKSIKVHQHHSRLLRPAWPPLMKSWHAELVALGELLGAEHDLTVLRAHLRKTYPSKQRPDSIRAILGGIERRRDELRTQAKPLGRRLLAEKPTALVRRVSRWWSAAAKDA